MTVWALHDVSRKFSGSGWFERRAHLALDRVSVSVSAGERVAIIGESGSGKTTLARVGLGLIAPTSGHVELFGQDTTRWSSLRWRRERKAAQLLFQDPRAMLNPGMTIGELLRESAWIHRPDADPVAETAAVLDAVGLAGRDGARPQELSGGERRRAGIARLLLARPRLVVADELTSGLDAALKAELVEMLLDRVGADCAVVFISHDLPVVLWSCQRVIVMKDGALVDQFATDAIDPDDRHPHTLRLLAASGVPPERLGRAQEGA